MDHQAKIESVDKVNNIAVLYAAEEGHNEVLTLFLKNYPSLAHQTGHRNWKSLCSAALWGHLHTVEYLIKKWNAIIDINHEDKDLQTPLHLTVKYNHPSVVDYQLQKGVDASIEDHEGKKAIDQPNENRNNSNFSKTKGKRINLKILTKQY